MLNSNQTFSRYRKYRSKKVNFIARYFIRKLGKVDGKNGMPKMNQDGIWTSPFILREFAEYLQFISKIEAEFQRYSVELQLRSRQLNAQIEDKKNQLIETVINDQDNQWLNFNILQNKSRIALIYGEIEQLEKEVKLIIDQRKSYHQIKIDSYWSGAILSNIVEMSGTPTLITQLQNQFGS